MSFLLFASAYIWFLQLYVPQAFALPKPQSRELIFSPLGYGWDRYSQTTLRGVSSKLARLPSNKGSTTTIGASS